MKHLTAVIAILLISAALGFAQYEFQNENEVQVPGVGNDVRIVPLGGEYRVDDGTHERSLGLAQGGTVGWFNQFQAVAGANKIISISLAWGFNSDGLNATVYLWTDPNNDGNPADAVIASQANTVAANSNTDIFNVVDIPDVTLNVGDVFYVGAFVTHAAGQFPASQDTTSPQRRSWVSLGPPNNLGAIFVGRIDDVGFPGNWLIRAQGVPEPASMIALGTGLAGLALRRRKK